MTVRQLGRPTLLVRAVDGILGTHKVDMGPTLGKSPEKPGSGLTWVKSSLSFANGNCVEVASLPDGTIGLRNSRDAEGPALRFTPDEWHAFLGGAQKGEFDSFGRK